MTVENCRGTRDSKFSGHVRELLPPLGITKERSVIGVRGKCSASTTARTDCRFDKGIGPALRNPGLIRLASGKMRPRSLHSWSGSGTTTIALALLRRPALMVKLQAGSFGDLLFGACSHVQSMDGILASSGSARMGSAKRDGLAIAAIGGQRSDSRVRGRAHGRGKTADACSCADASRDPGHQGSKRAQGRCSEGGYSQGRSSQGRSFQGHCSQGRCFQVRSFQVRSSQGCCSQVRSSQGCCSQGRSSQGGSCQGCCSQGRRECREGA